MGDQWASTDDHAPQVSQGPSVNPWANTEEHAAPQQSGSGSWLGSLTDFASGAWSQINPVAAAKSTWQMLRHPIDTGNAMVAAQANVEKKAEEAFKKGDYAEGMRHVLGYLLPVIGPQVDAMGDQAQSGRVAEALGEAAGFAAPAALGMRKIEPNMKALTKPAAVPASALNPVESAAVNMLNDRGVPLVLSTKTGNKFLKSAEAVTGSSPLGQPAAAQATRATEEGLRRVAGELAEQVHPNPVTPASAGEQVAAGLRSRVEDLGMQADAAYQDAWKARNDPKHTYNVPVKVDQKPILDAVGKPTGEMEPVEIRQPVNMPVDVRDIKEMLQPIWEEMQWMPAAEQASNSGFQAVKKILQGDDFIPAWQAEKGLGGLKSMARINNQSGVRNVSQGIGASIVPALQESIDAAVGSTGDAAIRGLQKGRSFHASKMEIADIADQLRSEPVQTFNKLVWKKDSGVEFLKKIQQQLPDSMPEIGRAYVEQLFDEATREGGFGRSRTMLSQWQNLGTETKALLFRNPALRRDLDNFFKGAAMVAENPNPSGTAIVEKATSFNPIRWLAGYGGGKLLFTPKGMALATKLLDPNLGPTARTAVQAQLQAMAAGATTNTAQPQ